MIFLKTPEQIEKMDKANRVVHSVLDAVEKAIKPGISTDELDLIAKDTLFSHDGATSAFKGYHGFPKYICISVNEEIVHGIPGDRVIQDGDIVSIDFGAHYLGFTGDAARTIIVGEVDKQVSDLVVNTKKSLFAGINQMFPGRRLHDIGAAIDAIAKKHKYGNVRGYCGHGIGINMHESPHVFNYVNNNEPNVRLRPGMVFALEPMFLLGSDDVETLEDNWTVVTKDRRLAVHWELSVAITEGGPRMLGVEDEYAKI